jgi:hypothetical protein
MMDESTCALAGCEQSLEGKAHPYAARCDICGQRTCWLHWRISPAAHWRVECDACAAQRVDEMKQVRSPDANKE